MEKRYFIYDAINDERFTGKFKGIINGKSCYELYHNGATYCTNINDSISPVPTYIILHARNLFTQTGENDDRFIIGYHIIEKTKYLSNISLGLNPIFGGKFIEIVIEK